ncbi:MAG: hypothetical protein LC624_07305 [Halobacteriales archaeon]|nr:hypothetical protein [Halobacteriales archaeon]
MARRQIHGACDDPRRVRRCASLQLSSDATPTKPTMWVPLTSRQAWKAMGLACSLQSWFRNVPMLYVTAADRPCTVTWSPAGAPVRSRSA